jgi:hypothetical protein
MSLASSQPELYKKEGRPICHCLAFEKSISQSKLLGVRLKSGFSNAIRLDRDAPEESCMTRTEFEVVKASDSLLS